MGWSRRIQISFHRSAILANHHFQQLLNKDKPSIINQEGNDPLDLHALECFNGLMWMRFETPTPIWTFTQNWHQLVTSGHTCLIWSQLDTSGHICITWSHMVTSVDNWSHLPHLVTPGYIWQHLVTSGQNWSQPSHTCHVCSHLVTPGYIWSHLVKTGHIWSYLSHLSHVVTSGHICSDLVTPVTSGHHWSHTLGKG